MKHATICSLTILLMLPILTMGASGPHITFDKEVHDFGPVPYGATVEGEFVVKNTGEGTLIIKNIEADCGCTRTVVGSQELSQGGESRIVAKFETTGLKPGKKQKHVRVHSNDPARPNVELTLLADVVRELDVDQSSLLRKVEGFSPEHLFTVNVTNSSNATRKITGIRVQDADCRVTTEDSDMTLPPGKTRPFSIMIRLSGASRPFYLGKVILETDHPLEKEIELKYLIQFAKPH
jgi:hypothetical protein